MSDKAKPCFNCKSRESKVYPVFCNDCWRMAIIVSVVGSSGTEALHRMMVMLFP